jgi:hypothetical protein
MAVSNIRILVENKIDSVTLSDSPTMVSTLSVENLQNSLRAKVARTTGIADQSILGDWSAPVSISGAAIWRTNLSDEGTWRLRLYDGAGQTGSVVYDSGVIDAAEKITLGDLNWGIDPLGATVYTEWDKISATLWFEAVSALSFELTLSDAGNSDGYMEVSGLYMGVAASPTFNAVNGLALKWQDDTKQERTDGGSLRSDAVEPYRVIQFNLDTLVESERAIFIEMMRSTGLRKDIFVSCFPGAGGKQERDYSFACKLSGQSSSTYATFNIYKQNFVMQEI